MTIWGPDGKGVAGGANADQPRDAGMDEDRMCRWCGRDSKWSPHWEFVNGKRWYHKACIALLDMVS